VKFADGFLMTQVCTVQTVNTDLRLQFKVGVLLFSSLGSSQANAKHNTG